VEDIRFQLDFSDSGSLEKIISGLEKVEGKYKDVQKSIEKAQKELIGTNDAKRITVLVAELDKLKREYAQLQTEVQKANEVKKKSTQLTDAEIIAETRHKESIN
jgi:predicted  nucleic acid-binding Zn-ribbon protein